MHKVQHKDAIYPFACTSCEYNAPNQENLLAHLKIHSDEKPYPCHICSYRAKNRTGINAHLKRKNHAAIRSVRITYKCRLCNHQTSTPSDLRNHIVTHIRLPDLIRLELICMCRYITKFEEIPIHINDHVKNVLQTEVDKLLIQFVCNIVNDGDEQNENMYNTATLQENIPSVHHPSVPLSYNSNYNYPGNIQGSSQSHNWLQSDNFASRQPFTSNLPPIHTINATNAFHSSSPGIRDVAPSHYSNGTSQTLLHASTPPSRSCSTKVTLDLTCTVCNYVAYNDSDLNYHVSTHSTVLYDEISKMPVLYSCDICNFKGSDESELMLHMTTHVAMKYNNGADVIDFICDICGYSTYSQSDLDIHKLVHNNEENILCKLCGYEASTSVDLRLHMILHAPSEESIDMLDSDSEELDSPFLMNSYDQQDFYDNRQSFVQSGLMHHQEQFATLPNHI